jgi:hypothetical protein
LILFFIAAFKMPPKGLEQLTIYKKGALIGHPDVIPMKYITQHVAQIMKSAEWPPLLFLEASTGSGKTTALPPELLISPDLARPRIGVVIPKVITTRRSYARIIETFTQLKPEQDVAYNTGSIKLGNAPLNLMTTGIFMEGIKYLTPETEPHFLRKYSIIIIDEAHKQTMENDFILLFIKTIINNPYLSRHQMPLFILMSGTLDIASCMNYFGLDNESERDRFRHTIQVSGQTSIRRDTFMITPSVSAQKTAFDIILQITGARDFDGGSILVFLPTIHDINLLYGRLNTWIIKNTVPLLPIIVTRRDISSYGDNYTLTEIGADRIKRFGKKISKVYISTNIAEEGVTLDKLQHVIDVGYSNNVEYCPYYMATCTLVKPISQSSAKQRWGRTGRDLEGQAYICYSKETYDLLDPVDQADFIRRDFATEFISLYKRGTDFGALINAPPHELRYNIQDRAFYLGLITSPAYHPNNPPNADVKVEIISNTVKPIIRPPEYIGEITLLGDLMGALTSAPIEAIKTILCGYAYDICVSDLITIVAASSILRIKTNLQIADQAISAAIRLELYMFGHNAASDSVMCDESFVTSIVRNKRAVYLTEDVLANILDMRYRIVQNFAANNLAIYNVPSQLHLLRDIELGIEALSPTSSATSALAGYKRCIYEGYKLNLITRNHCSGGAPISYKNIFGHIVTVDDVFDTITQRTSHAIGITECDYPIYFCAKQFEIKKNMVGKYELCAICVSAMDGFVEVDPNFALPVTSTPRNLDLQLTEEQLMKYRASLPMGKRLQESALISITNEHVQGLVKRELKRIAELDMKSAPMSAHMGDFEIAIS